MQPLERGKNPIQVFFLEADAVVFDVMLEAPLPFVEPRALTTGFSPS
jgi:hypothetical protein